MVSLDPGVWIAAIFTIGIYSLGFKYNRLFKFCEYTFIGLSAGLSLVFAFENIVKIGIQGLTGGKTVMIIPIILGILLYTRYNPKHYWLSRYPIALMVGVGMGISVRGYIHADIIQQITATAKPLWGPLDPLTYINNLLIIILVVSGLIFFIFTIRGREKLTPISRIGRLGLMIGFGAMIANTVMTRYTFFIGRIRFILFEWLAL